MTLITRLETAVKKRSNARPKSLILHIPAFVRDIMEFEHNTPIVLDVCVENDVKCIKIYKKMD